MIFNERHKAFLEKIQSGLKEFEANAAACCDTQVNTDNDELMAELARKFTELFGTDSD